MASTENTGTIDHSGAAEWFRRDVEAGERDLLAVLRRHWPNLGSQGIAHLLIQTNGSVLGAIVEAEPAARADIETKLAHLCLFIATTNQPPQ